MHHPLKWRWLRLSVYGGMRGFRVDCSRFTEFTMSIWPQDLSKNTLEEVVSLHAENMRTSKHVGFRTKTIIERKLAGKINREEYLAERKLATEDAAECVRRRTLLLAELGRRENWCDSAAYWPVESDALEKHFNQRATRAFANYAPTKDLNSTRWKSKN
jgi:hypothetical protein